MTIDSLLYSNDNTTVSTFDEGKINKCPDFVKLHKKTLLFIYNYCELLHLFCQVVKRIKVFIPEIFMFHKGPFK